VWQSRALDAQEAHSVFQAPGAQDYGCIQQLWQRLPAWMSYPAQDGLGGRLSAFYGSQSQCRLPLACTAAIDWRLQVLPRYLHIPFKSVSSSILQRMLFETVCVQNLFPCQIEIAGCLATEHMVTAYNPSVNGENTYIAFDIDLSTTSGEEEEDITSFQPHQAD
jgi:hypothetical protein